MKTFPLAHINLTLHGLFTLIFRHWQFSKCLHKWLIIDWGWHKSQNTTRIICSLPDFKLSWGECFEIGCLPHLPGFWGWEANQSYCKKTGMVFPPASLFPSLLLSKQSLLKWQIKNCHQKNPKCDDYRFLPSYLTVNGHPLSLLIPSTKSKAITKMGGRVLSIKPNQVKDKWDLKAIHWHWFFFLTKHYL